MAQDDMASASGIGPSQAEPKVSALRSSVPDAWRRTFRMEWSMDAGPAVFSYPGNMTEGDIYDLKSLLEVAFQGMVRRAQAIEARRAETGTGSVHEGAIRQDAPKSVTEDQPREGEHGSE